MDITGKGFLEKGREEEILFRAALKRGPKARPIIRFDSAGDIGANPDGHVVRSDGTRQT